MARVPYAELSLVASRREETRRLLPSGCDLISDWHELMDPSRIDGVIIATPPPLHADMVLAALNVGLPVLVEKPLTLNLAEAQEIERAAANLGSVVFVDHVYLFHDGYRKMRDIARVRGDISSISAIGGGKGPFRLDTPPLWDYGTHYVAMCLDLLQEDPITISSHVERREAQGEVVSIDLGFPDGSSADLLVGNLMREKTRRFCVQGTGWTLLFDDLAPDPLIESRAGYATAIHVSQEPSLETAVREFVAAVRLGEISVDSLDLAVRTVAVLEAATSASGSATDESL